MLRLTLAQMRRSLGRLVAAGVAIGIGTAFVAATLLAGAAMTRTTYDAVTTGYADADLVVTDGTVSDATLEVVSSTPGVRAVQGYLELLVELRGPDGQTFLPSRAAAVDPSLEPAVLVAGRLPTGPGEVALPDATAELLGVRTGGRIEATQTGYRVSDDGTESSEERTDELTVVGLLAQPAAAFLTSGGVAVVTADRLDTWRTFMETAPEDAAYWYATVDVASPDDVARVQSELRSALGTDGPLQVRTLDEQAQKVTADLTGDANQLTAIVLGFAAVALLVAALVIANTFQVIVAQRTRTLALLRCVGADRAQLRRSVILEALLVGIGSSTAGLVLGTALVQGALLVLNGRFTDVPLPRVVAITPAVVLVPLVIGTAVTVLAGLAPARAATRVSPLAALRPADAPRVDDRSGRARAVVAAVLVIGGASGLVLGSVVAARLDTLLGLGVGMLGGAASFLGVVVGSVFWVPRLVGWTGRLLGSSPTARLAAANSLRNPRRTAATSAALFIGVTLVAMMATGAASTRTALDVTLSQQFSVDVSVGTVDMGEGPRRLPTGFSEQAAAIEGVGVLTELTGATLELVPADPSAAPVPYLGAFGVDPADAVAVVRAPEQVAGLSDSTVIVPSDMAGYMGVVDGQDVVLRRQLEGTADSEASAEKGTGQPQGAAGPTVTLTARVTELPGFGLLLTSATLDALVPQAPVTHLWMQLADPDDAERVVGAVTSAASESGESLETVGASVERAYYQRVVNTLLAVVIGLLGVAVIIALVGVTNTLSLSVLERRRESATLRALGLSRRQLRGTLAIEGMLIAGVGSVVGSVLGTLYGWAGARTLLGNLADVGLTVPWRDLAIVITVGLLAGLLASVLPGRSAARTSPVEALAVE